MARNHTTSKFQVGVIAAFVFLFLLLPAVSAARHTVRYENVRQFLPRRSMTALAIERILLLAENRTKVITVRKDGSGDFATVADAVNSIPAGVSRRTVIHIGPGLYREKVTVDHSKPFVTFYGDRHAMPRISFDGTAAQFGTFLSATVAVESHYFVACNIIFENTAPKPADGQAGAQAVAMRISGDKAAFYNCKFYGYQDTLCDDRAQARENISDKSGFSFVSCRISGTGDAFLSRAWKPRSRVVFAYTYMGSLVDPLGWSDKGLPERQRTVYYGEYKCTGPGSATKNRVSYGKILNDSQARPFLSKDFINGATWLLPPPRLRAF
ncbi:putative pectinesterase 63 [Ananas comosus]|uniref:pectinesterase n=1 Tax=Ananas comosus TaxID=4615 RepID=A0A199UKE9_ANACO|nr:putative pectinesterase 63 [Ananas comosus]